MTTLTKTQAQARADQIRAFRTEQNLLEAQGLLLLPDDTAAAVRQFHDALLHELKHAQDVDLSEGG